MFLSYQELVSLVEKENRNEDKLEKFIVSNMYTSDEDGRNILHHAVIDDNFLLCKYITTYCTKLTKLTDKYNKVPIKYNKSSQVEELLLEGEKKEDENNKAPHNQFKGLLSDKEKIVYENVPFPVTTASVPPGYSNSRLINICKNGDLEEIKRHLSDNFENFNFIIKYSIEHKNIKLFQMLIANFKEYIVEDDFQKYMEIAINYANCEVIEFMILNISFVFDYSDVSYKNRSVFNCLEKYNCNINVEKCLLDSFASKDLEYFNYVTVKFGYDKLLEHNDIDSIKSLNKKLDELANN